MTGIGIGIGIEDLELELELELLSSGIVIVIGIVKSENAGIEIGIAIAKSELTPALEEKPAAGGQMPADRLKWDHRRMRPLYRSLMYY